MELYSLIKKGINERKSLIDIYNLLGDDIKKVDFYKAVLNLVEDGEIPNVLICYCGHDCSKCLTFRATLFNDEAMRKRSAYFYKAEFNQDLPLQSLYCLSGKSDEIMEGCHQCPYMKCCKENNLDSCSDCSDYPCKMIEWYLEKYVNKVNQI